MDVVREQGHGVMCVGEGLEGSKLYVRLINFYESFINRVDKVGRGVCTKYFTKGRG